MNLLNRKFASAYELLYLRNADEFNPREFLKLVKGEMGKQKNAEDISKIPMEFALIYAFFDSRSYNLVSSNIDELRTMELLATCFHRNNELERARELCDDMIFQNERVSLLPKATAYCIMGETYILTDYELSKYYLNKGLSLVASPSNQKMRKKQQMLQTTLYFLNIHFEKNLDYINPINPTERRYLYIKQDMKQKADSLMEETKKQNGFLTTLQLFVQALAREDMNLMREALLAFERNNDLFYAELPKNVLK
ncbi:AimR family lysis-lysogeny pheromone receptor [Bacillus sp. AR18-7]|uniref:AimR family lysis-lysogeny pheromone receptor n=1 Tax=Bacillus sp. AR18-7 TaxID=2217821 RepID=UPI002714CCBE|nr:AimR family lysis-lysogeny pheromone receptor [Bacillus sp. AR18-7]